MPPVPRDADVPALAEEGLATSNADTTNTPHQRVIFLTGAPNPSKIDWTSSSLHHDFCGRIQRFLQHNLLNQHGLRAAAPSSRTSTTSTSTSAKWRAVPLTSSSIDTLSFQDHAERSAFLEHTLTTALDAFDGARDHPSETSASTESFTSIISSDMSLTSSDDTSSQPHSSNSAAAAAAAPADQVPNLTSAIHDLKQIPSAGKIQAIHPQTKTLDALLVGVISVELRTVQLRTRNIEMELVEVLVGDETATPFKITFWLPIAAPGPITGPALGPGHGATAPITRSRSAAAKHSPNLNAIPKSKAGATQASPDSARATLYSLRTGDVILVSNVALHVYKSVVYGQSLPRRLKAHATRVTILTTTKSIRGLSTAAAAKLEKVRSWTREFVGLPPKLKRAADVESDGDGRDWNGKRARWRTTREEGVLPNDTPMDL